MPKMKITPSNFIATVYGELTPLNNSAFSKARLKIFYKGLNRNGSYITDEVAEKLLATLPGTPVVGFFSGEKDDFEGHMPWSPEELKAYGFVPQDMNFSWEMSLDPDGVYRTYACTDIILWTGRYPVASRIVGKSHSMELNPDTVQGEWIETEDDFYFEFTSAEFFGLCVLGEDYEPCFEGSSFYDLHKPAEKKVFSKELQEMFSLYKGNLDNADENQTGGQEMSKKNKDQFAEEEEDKKLNPEEEQDKKPTDEEPEDNKEPKDEPEDKEEPDDEPADDKEDDKEDNGDKEDDKENDGEEKDGDEEEEEKDNSDKQDGSDKEPELESQLAAKDEEIASLKAQLEELNSYKLQKVKEEKEKVLEAYSKKLSDEELEDFKGKIDEYETATDLKKEIALCILDKESADEETDETNYAFVGNRKEKLTGIEAIVAKYAKNK